VMYIRGGASPEPHRLQLVVLVIIQDLGSHVPDSRVMQKSLGRVPRLRVEERVV
jgi:hypothetical protein